MKRFLACFLAPLLVILLSSFNHSSTNKVQEKDSSTVVNVHFSPAQVVVSDERSDLIYKNLQLTQLNNSQIALALDSMAGILVKEQRERRGETYITRASNWLKISPKRVERVMHNKFIFDCIAYTLFAVAIITLIYFAASLTRTRVLTSKHLWKIIPLVVWLISYYALIQCFERIFFPLYPYIREIINNPPG